MTTRAPHDGLGVDVRLYEDLALVTLTGPLDIYTVPDVRLELEGHVCEDRQVVVDLTEVTLLDSSGLGLLLSLRNRALRDGSGRLGLICPHRRLRRVFEITGLRQEFVFGRDLAGVRAALGGPR